MPCIKFIRMGATSSAFLDTSIKQLQIRNDKSSRPSKYFLPHLLILIGSAIVQDLPKPTATFPPHKARYHRTIDLQKAGH